MISAIIGKKHDQSQKFLENGIRVPVTGITVPPLPVVSVKTADQHGYWAVMLGIDTKKHSTKADRGNIRGAKLEKAPQFLREVRIKAKNTTLDQLPKVGEIILVQNVLKPGDIVDVTGVSKGKGYAGVVKRHGFRGGPRTHGQSDRERAPGSIGQTTTPGRVYKGKRMAGRMGQKQVTVRNLQVIDVLENTVLIKGLVPGGSNSVVVIKKVGEVNKFVPLYKVTIEETQKQEGEKHAA